MGGDVAVVDGEAELVVAAGINGLVVVGKGRARRSMNNPQSIGGESSAMRTTGLESLRNAWEEEGVEAWGWIALFTVVDLASMTAILPPYVQGSLFPISLVNPTSGHF